MKLSLVLLAAGSSAVLAFSQPNQSAGLLFRRGSQSLEHAIRASPELAAQVIRRHYDESGNAKCECPDDGSEEWGSSSEWYQSYSWTQVSISII